MSVIFEADQKIKLNPFLPILATSVLACWPSAAVMQLQKNDHLNSDGCNFPCRAHYLFKFDIPHEKWLLFSVLLSLSLLGVYLLIEHKTFFKHL